MFSFVIKSSNTSSRCYEWFKDKNGVVYGHFNHGNCLNKIESIESYYHPGKLRECDYCVCNCVINPFSEGPQVAVISFREQVSDINDGMIVVGVKFMQKDNIMQIQIKQGKLYPNELIRDSNWIELETIRKDSKFQKFFVDVNVNYSKQLTSGVDYGLTNGINFDDVFAPERFVVTGVRLHHAGNFVSAFGEDSIGLEIRITRFDFSSGNLSLLETYWSSGNEDTREEMVITNPDNLIRSPKNLIISKKNKFIRFKASDLKKDAGQSTVPFFDAQEVGGDPEFLLGGVGVILRGHK
ncbi:uncharacterized protein LOC141524036 [Cotesia typhae]|uniref:uncharacterized protein LOC141524036 n=1 Tax=Cotesia typhae TaxID=2053667 RepID=UPI003D683CF3